MTKSSQKNNIMQKPQKRSPRKIQHAFTNVREPLLTTFSTKVVASLTPVNGSVTLTGVLTPAGLKSVYWDGAKFVSQGVTDPMLSWLYNQSGNFGYYRVTRAKLVFVGNAGSTITGSLNLFGSRDAMDAGTGINTAYMQGSGSKSFDLASSSSKELSLNLPIDSSWKKVSPILATPANVQPFTGPVTAFANVNSVGDLSFGAFAAQIVSGPNQNCGSLFLDYDVEFKDPMSLSMNA